MSYHGDISLEDTIDIKFTTRRFSTGAPFTLAGTPAISAYVGNSTTEITAGITLSVDFDSRTGLNNVRVVATAANGYTAATNVQLVITAGTVDSVSVVGEVVGSFSIAARSSLRPTVAGRTLDVSAGGEAGVDWANVGSPTTTVGLSGTTVKTATDVETDTADIQSKIGTPAGASVSADVTAVKVDTAAILVDTAEIGAAGAGLTAINLPNQTMDIVGNITGNLSGSVGSVTGNVGGNVTGSVGSLATQAKADVNAEADTAIADAALATAAALATVDGIVDDLKSGIIYGATATGTLSTTQATTNLSGYADDQLIGRHITFLTGPCDGEQTDITDYASASGLLTFTALTTPPTNGDTFKIT